MSINTFLKPIRENLVTLTKFSELQKRIALLLMHESKTGEELNNQLDIPYDQLMDELKGLLKLKVISREGFPTVYKLNKSIESEIRKRKELTEKDKNKLMLRIAIEVQAIEEDLLRKNLDDLKKKIEAQEDFQIYKIEEAEIIENNGMVSTFLDITLSLKDFRSLTKLVFFFGPASVEVLKPEMFELRAEELQDSLITMLDMVHGYTDYIYKLMSKKQIEEFNNKFYKK